MRETKNKFTDKKTKEKNVNYLDLLMKMSEKKNQVKIKSSVELSYVDSRHMCREKRKESKNVAWIPYIYYVIFMVRDGGEID